MPLAPITSMENCEYKDDQICWDSFEYEKGYCSEGACSDESSSENCSLDEQPENTNTGDVIAEPDLTSFIQDWILKFKIGHNALKPLLCRLVEYDRTLPIDPRRLLDTPREPAKIEVIQGGQYWHNGLGKSIFYCDI